MKMQRRQTVIYLPTTEPLGSSPTSAMKNPVSLVFALLLFSVCSAQTDSLTGVPVAQPLSIASFSATPLDKNIQLVWTVTGNEDAKSFVVERSDVQSVWARIGGKLASGKVGGAGYEFIDAMPKANAVYTYRLIAVGKDGSVLYSAPQGLSVNSAFACALKKIPFNSTWSWTRRHLRLYPCGSPFLPPMAKK